MFDFMMILFDKLVCLIGMVNVFVLIDVCIDEDFVVDL